METSNAESILCQYPVMKSIFEKLPAKGLNVAAQVCRHWCEMAEFIKSTRGEISWIYLTKYELEKLKKMPTRILKQMQSLQSEPYIALAFCDIDTAYKFLNFSCMEDLQKMPLITLMSNYANDMSKTDKAVLLFLRSQLPVKTSITVFHTFGFYGYFPGALKRSFSTLLIPKLPNVKVYQGSLFTDDRRELQQNVQMLLDTADGVKCILLFFKYQHSREIEKFVQYLMRNQECPISVGGISIIRCAQDHQVHNSYSTTHAIVFAGKGAEALSVEITPEDTEIEIKEKLLVFQQLNFVKGQCIGFLFRQKCYYPRESLQTLAGMFRNVYLKVPLYCCTGEAIIGKNGNTEKDNSRPKKLCAVFVGISFKN